MASYGGDYFMHRIKRSGTTYDKGIEVHNNLDSAKGAYYAYLGAYAYGRAQDANVNFVSCHITDMGGFVLISDTWNKPEPEPEPEEEPKE